MQFKHPEILYFLVLLLIPVIIHLFQLQRFVTVPFTNVAFLQKLALQTRKSSRIKKWLVLATRLLAFAFLILAFAQPYFSDRKASEQVSYFVYLDNSLSTHTQGKKGDILQVAVQEFIENLSDKATYSLQTNTHFYRNKTALEIKEIALQIAYTTHQKSLEDIYLKMSSENPTNRSTVKNIFISDFQHISPEKFNDIDTPISLVQLTPQLKENISIDSVFVNEASANNIEVSILVKNQGIAKNNIPIAIYNHHQLVNKQTFAIAENTTKKVTFSIQQVPTFLGALVLNYNDAFLFDNSFYFTLTTTEKINVLTLGKPASFLAKIYTDDEFNYAQSTLQSINYNAIAKQQLLILNELDNIPQTLQMSLVDFTKNGGDLVVIPSRNSSIPVYNQFFKKLGVRGTILSQQTDSLKVTSINFKHPIFRNVFEKNVRNFQYPSVVSSYHSSFNEASTVLSFENKKDFISQLSLSNSKLFWLASPLHKKYSNFINSPLIVPIFYNIGKQSLQLPKLYYTVYQKNVIDINRSFTKDAVLSVRNRYNSFIPLQQVLQNNVRITTTTQPSKSGFAVITQQNDTLKQIAYNYNTRESLLNYGAIQNSASQKENLHFSTSVEDTFKRLQKKNEVQWLWKLFLALAIVSLLMEILILKFFKT